MPSHYRRARMESDDPRIRIRNRYMEAIRAGAPINEATQFANADPADQPTFTKAPVKAVMPSHERPRAVAPPTETATVERTGYGAPGEQLQLLPQGWAAGDGPPPTPALSATDPSTESVKRPTPPPPPEPKAAPKAKAAPAIGEKTTIRAPLPNGWDSKEFPWPDLRTLCMGMGLPAPDSRGHAARLIRKKLGIAEPPPPPPEPEADAAPPAEGEANNG